MAAVIRLSFLRHCVVFVRLCAGFAEALVVGLMEVCAVAISRFETKIKERTDSLHMFDFYGCLSIIA
ncbi:hypothetical protein llap_20109 [Limosa lapponica baueri]|uniref:Uncharacterized protein n=1 Tax=Limosa lapponica baueri TaxID=1758121 RepID=A0A2I0T744_LIMLA|nr:hypothetical protein llap_20109 [Limosa lapponica baueri]